MTLLEIRGLWARKPGGMVKDIYGRPVKDTDLLEIIVVQLLPIVEAALDVMEDGRGSSELADAIDALNRDLP